VILPPRRSVTRFFVPLIDVLILLFAIFLLMPFVSGPAASEPSDAKVTPPKEPLPENVKELQRELSEARDRIKRMELAAQARLNDQLSVRVLMIDRKDGTLYYYDPERQEIRTEADALKVISRQKALASASGKDVFFLILFPPKSSYPTQEQVNQIRQWFKAKDVPVGFDTGLAGG
jgi:hypothetical protein